jgi:hypothetical protein
MVSLSDAKNTSLAEATSGDDLDAYNQYVVLHIINDLGTGSLNIVNAYHKQHVSLLPFLYPLTIPSGKFHKNGDKDSEFNESEVNNIVIPAGTSVDISGCGRVGAALGIEGSIELWEGSTQVTKLYFNSPYSGRNNFSHSENGGGGYIVINGPWNEVGGALGKVDVEIFKRG